MAGAGRRVFQPGEVLTASNTMNYLMDQSVMTFAGTAARGSAIGTAVSEGMVSYLNDNNFVQVHDGTGYRSLAGVQIASGTAARDTLLPSPIQGDKVFRNDLGYEQTYYGLYNSSTNPGGRASAGWYNDQRNMGLVPIVPPTVNYSGGTATANTLGTVSFSAVTSISLNNVFTSNYKNYRLVLAMDTQSTASAQYVRFRAAGTDATTGAYTWIISVNSTTGGPNRYSGVGSTNWEWSIGGGGLNSSFAVADISNPATTVVTTGMYQAMSPISTYEFRVGSFVHNSGVSYDGLTIYPGSGTMTGSLTVYGYNS